jgi:hypothetical protein
MSNNYSNSSFWYDFDKDDNRDVITGQEIKLGKDYVKMAATLRAISNFVRIVTGENIPVKYNNKDESFTDGKTVVISGNIKDKDFDPTVGLALHEGSHCLLTDFDIIKPTNFEKYIEDTFDLGRIARKYNYYETEWSDEKNEYVSTGKYNTFDCMRHISTTLQQILNFVEDRRIDYYIYKNAPGYQGYYEALYDKYFHSRVIDKALQSNEKTNLDLDSYMFRLINITNSNRNFSALPGLMKIWKTIDLKNIDRLKTTKDALDVATDVYNIIESNIPAPEKQEDNGGDTRGDEAQSKNYNHTDSCNDQCGGTCNNDEGPSTVTDEQVEKMIEDMEKTVKEAIENGDDDDGSKAKGSTPKSSKANKMIELSDSQKRSLDKAIEKQKELINGKIKKSNISKKDRNNIQAIQESGSETKTVGKGQPGKYMYTKSAGTDCLIVKTLTKSLIDSQVYSTLTEREWRFDKNQNAINDGIRLGTQLGRKLQVRNDERSLKYTRLNRGKLDKRLVSSLGYGYESVFNQVFEERFNPAVVHISVDASGSMSGEKWKNAQKATVAIAKAASMVGNLDIIISYRSTEEIGNKMVPAIFIAYDSRKDKINKIQNLFKHICCPGVTPEGLCFEAIQKEIVDGSGDKDSYFINFSDGEPYFENKDIMYWGQSAYKHTKSQVDNMRLRGIKVLSYFIGGGYGSNIDNFKAMYGQDSEFINTNQVVPLAKTLNKMFATK